MNLQPLGGMRLSYVYTDTTATSDANGYFLLSDLGLMGHNETVTAEKEGYITVNKTVLNDKAFRDVVIIMVREE